MGDRDPYDERVDCDIGVTLSLAGRQIWGRARNVSLGGMRIELGQPPAVGMPVRVRLMSTAAAAEESFQATVRWREALIVGVAFSRNDVRWLHALYRLLRELRPNEHAGQLK